MPRRRNSQPALRFDQKLVLNQWMLSLFERDFEALASQLNLPDLEGLDENNVHKFLHQIKLLWEFEAFPGDTLLGYDQNIVRHTQRISEKRREPLRWKYFQWLSLLFAEVYLDRFFRDSEKLLDDLNAYLAKSNADKPSKEQLPPYQMSDLTKLAFWNATGSGKTLLMHVNILQHQHYLNLYGKVQDLNRIILLTPNEGLSRQHLIEFQTSGLNAALFDKDAGSLFTGQLIEIIDIHKLRDEMGEKTVAIDAFEGNNLVLVDEGHRGASASEVGRWMQARSRLCEDGFSFEYSATFGQAVKGKGELEKTYAKCILFDYSYKYFYKDGFGKDYHILNLADDSDEERRRLYLVACLFTFYQQKKLYQDSPNEFRPFLLENPLWVFVGGTVNAVRTQRGQKVSDVVDILRFLAEFTKDRRQSVQLLNRLLSGKPGLLDQGGKEIFANAYPYISKLDLSAEQLFDDVLQVVFNASVPGALHVEHLKGSDGEIALRLGEYEPFGLINVGDAPALCKLCEEQQDVLVVTDKDFSTSLFSHINDEDSTINVLIGSKKFTEGWNSWRVSTMGLMNVGRSEGSEIIQLFGRGVRLKGYGLSLKRSKYMDLAHKPKYIQLLETLNIFGIRAQYMQQFKEYLEDEGLPANEDRVEIVLPVIKNLNGKKLRSIRLKDGVDFKRQGPKPTLSDPPDRLLKHPVTINWYPKIQSRQSKDASKTETAAVLDECKFQDEHIAFMDLDAIWFELQNYKNERAWFNLNLPRNEVASLLRQTEWYRLLIPRAEMEWTRFDRVRRWEEIAAALLKKYVDRYYHYHKDAWEKDHLEYHVLTENDPNFVDEYRLMIERSQESIVENLNVLRGILEAQSFSKSWEFGNLHAFWFSQHLYLPLLHFGGDLVEVSPVGLNEGERDFVLDLRTFYEEHKEFFRDRDMYLLRNMSRGRGIGFFEAGNFHPDFILWIIAGGKQYVTFVDPKGIRNLEGPNDPKIRFYKTIKEIESRLGDPSVILNSFIVSNTPFRDVGWWGDGLTREDLEVAHVLFQKDDKERYIGRLLEAVVSSEQVHA